jgi:hypothetical protein
MLRKMLYLIHLTLLKKLKSLTSSQGQNVLIREPNIYSDSG